jgi:hypothetical protein
MRQSTPVPVSRRLAVAFGVLLVLTAAATAFAAPKAAETRALLLTQRFTPDTAPAASDPLATSLVALRGETEGFQFVVRAPGTRLKARLTATSDPFFVGKTRFLRAGFVNVTTPSAVVSLGAGKYEDPLPPQTNAGLTTTPGQWGGFVVLIDVPRSAIPGTYHGEISVSDETGADVANQPFDFKVSTVQTLAPTDKSAFKAIGGFLTGWYLNYAPIGDPQADNGAKLLKLYGSLTSFLAQHMITPTGWDYGRPDKNGHYADGSCATCWWRSPEFPDAYQSQTWPAKVLPARGDKFTLERDWSTHGAAFLKNVGAYWKSHDWIGDNTYLWAWDEPGNKQETKDIPAIDKLVHENAPGVKTFATAFPYDFRKARRLCKRFGNRSCHVFPGQKTSNKVLWDGGPDDLDAWLIAAHRYYGTWTSGLEQQYKIDHTLDAYQLEQKVRARGKEIWSYTYFMPTKSIPQLTIDGAPTDPELLMLWNGYEKNAGWLIWHMNRWVDGHVLNAAQAKPRNPYDDTISSKTPKGELANGDVSLFYPPVSQEYGLTDPTAEPVTSIRFEELRDGIEDVNLVTLYRQKFGDAATRKALGAVFGKVQVVANGGFTWPAYSNTGIADRMEQVRRTLITALEI